jgi:hypothetical protein
MRKKNKMFNTVHVERNILHTVNRRKANWIGHILRRNCLMKEVIGGKIEGRIVVMETRGRRREQLLDAAKEMSGCWKLKEETLDRTVWRNGVGKGWGPIVRRTVEGMNEGRDG